MAYCDVRDISDYSTSIHKNSGIRNKQEVSSAKKNKNFLLYIFGMKKKR